MFSLNTEIAVQSIETLLYSISTLLYLPVLLAVSALVLYLLSYIGAFMREWRERRRGIRTLVVEAEASMTASAASIPPADLQPALDTRLERIVQQAETQGLRRLEAVRFAVRVGPALGLMGTLIPMGISLAGLAQGNLPKMAESMVTAFTATVVGLACSIVAYLLSLVREHWLRADMTEVAYAAETVLARHTRPAPVARHAKTETEA
jgi:biopolymer transport protein ExbB/TolQ